jgi:hypothetical protein
MRPVETILSRREGEIKEKDGVNLTKIYCKHFVNTTMDPQYNNNMTKKCNSGMLAVGHSISTSCIKAQQKRLMVIDQPYAKSKITRLRLAQELAILVWQEG